MVSRSFGGSVNFALGDAAGPKHPPLAAIAERYRAQKKMDLVAQLFPQIVRQTSAPVDAAAGNRSGGTSHRMDRLVDGSDDVADARIVAIICQEVAATRPAHALDQAVAPQFGEELFEVRQGNLLSIGDIGKADRGAITMAREIDHRHDGIAGLGAELHGFALATR